MRLQVCLRVSPEAQGIRGREQMGCILLVDDDAAYNKFLSTYIQENYPLLSVETCTDPFCAIASLNKRQHYDLVLIDLEMPAVDGSKIFRFALESGVDKNRIVILSGRDSDYLHDHFPMGTCLAVLNKFESQQKAVLNMIFSSLQRKSTG